MVSLKDKYKSTNIGFHTFLEDLSDVFKVPNAYSKDSRIHRLNRYKFSYKTFSFRERIMHSKHAPMLFIRENAVIIMRME